MMSCQARDLAGPGQLGSGSPSGLPVNDLCAVPTHVKLLYLRASMKMKSSLGYILLINNEDIRTRQDVDEVFHTLG